LTLTWSTSTSDAAGSFSVELHHVSFHDIYAIATNVDSSSLSKTVVIPEVPATDGYYIEFIDISNVNSVFATSDTFSIGAESATQSVTVGESAVPTVQSSSGSNSLTGSNTGTDVPISTKPIPSTTPAGAATTPTASPSGSSGASSAAPSVTGTGAALSTRPVFGGALLVALGVVFAL